jgi:DHA1 family bicyclomycin/chloramphenicol resistance-like MFS transporter
MLDVDPVVFCMSATRTRDVSALLLGALSFIAPFSIDVSLPGLPAIGAAIGAPGGLMQWTLAAYVLATGFGLLFWGPFADRFGRRPTILIGLALYAASALACAVTSTVAILIGLRFLQGLGSCAGSVCAFAIVHDLAHAPAERASRQATITAVTNIGPLAAPIAGVAILTWLGWRFLYAIPGLAGIALFAAVVAWVPETAPFSAGAPLERFRRVFALPRTLALTATIFALFGGYFAMISGSPFALVAQLHLSTAAFAGAFAIEAASALLGSFASSRLAFRFSPETLLAAAIALALAAGCANGVAGTWLPSPATFIITMSFYAFAFGVALPSAIALTLADAGPDAGVASGVLLAGLSLGGAAGSALGGAVPGLPTAGIGAVVAAAAWASALAYALSRRTVAAH